MTANEVIIQKLKEGPIKSCEIGLILKEITGNDYNHDLVRWYMRNLENNLINAGILIESSLKGYFIPGTKEEAIEGLEFIKRKAMGLLKRYNKRLRLYKKIFPDINQIEIEL